MKKGAVLWLVAIVEYSGMVEETLVDDFEITGPGILAVAPQGKLATTWAGMKQGR